jgi:hypothetical protein
MKMRSVFGVLVVILVPLLLGVASRDIRGAGSSAAKEEGAKCFAGIASLFQKGTTRVDLEQFKQLLLAYEAVDDGKKAFSAQSEEYHKRCEALLEYMDTHRLEAVDIQELREWACSSLDASTDDPEALFKSLAFRLSRSLGRVWGAVQAGEGRCAPRHAILCSVISDSPRSLRQLASSVGVIRSAKRGSRTDGVDRLRTMERFLLEKQNDLLWSEIQADVTILERLANDGRQLEADDLTQLLLDSKEVPGKFRQSLDKFLPLSKKLLLELPEYALPERFQGCARLRAVWNIVHAFGDVESRKQLEQHLLGLVKHCEGDQDAVTAEWLRQVMVKPGTPVDQYVKIIFLRPVEPKKADKE